MSVVVFCGPTISHEEVLRELAADVRGPAQRGDVLRAALERPRAIALIDGYFDRVPSVWHKEILWAMREGIHVFGSSSMGALRAAELAPFGMAGVGEIFEAFQRGELEDDDEVAVAHADAEFGYRRVSDAMVNIRFTLREAERQGVVSRTTRNDLESAAKAVPYHARELQALLTSRSPTFETNALLAWLPSNAVDQKKRDAVTMLRRIAALLQQSLPRKQVKCHLAETDGWLVLLKEIETQVATRSIDRIVPALEDELRARGMLGTTLRAAALRWLAEHRLRAAGIELDSRAVEAWIDDFRRENDLSSAESFAAWLEAAELPEAELGRFFRSEAVLRATRAELRNLVGRAVEDELRAVGLFAEVAAAAVRKADTLRDSAIASPTLNDVGLSEEELWQWYFSERLRIDVPTSIERYAALEGSSIEDLRLSVLRELVFSRLQSTSSPC